MPTYQVSFTNGDPLPVNAPTEDAAKAHAQAVTTHQIDGQAVAVRGVAVAATLVKP